MEQKIKRITWSAGICALFLAVLLMPLAGQVQAEDRYWIGGTSNWNVDGNWDDGSGSGPGVPVTGDSAYIQSSGATVTFDHNYPIDGRLGYLNIDNNSSLTLLSTAQTLGVGFGPVDGGGIVIGDTGKGTLTQQGGEVNISGNYGALVLGDSTTGVGYYMLEGGTLRLLGNEEYIGGYGKGYFNQGGGTHELNAAMYIGTSSGGYGLYTMTGGILQAGSGGGAIVLGEYGKGEFLQSGGAVTIDNLTLARQSGSTGNYYLSGDPATSTLTSNGVTVGGEGVGKFYQGYTYNPDTKVVTPVSNGGTHTVNGDLNIASNTTANGSAYYLNSGSLNVSGITRVGDYGRGYFYQDGGTFTANEVWLGVGTGSYGEYNISGPGNLQTGYLIIGGKDYIGEPGTGVFNQNSGTVNAGGLWVADTEGSNGTYNLHSGSLTVDTYNIIGMRGEGTFNQYGGTHTANYILELGGSATGNGTYNLVDGVLTTNGTIVGSWGSGTFNQGVDPVTGYITAGGTHTVYGDLVLGANGGISGTYNLYRGNLNVDGWAIIGGNGNGYFYQEGGNFNLTGGSSDIYLGGSPYHTGGYGRYDMSGGTLSAGWLYVGYLGEGDFVQNGGTVKVAYEMNVGTGSGSYGTYSLYGDGLDASTAALYVGRSPGSTGFFNQGGGTLTADWLDVGSEGTGTFTQWNGTTTVNNTLVLGREIGSIGMYNLSGDDSVTLTTGETGVGAFGKGTFTQSGGTHSTGTLVLGYNIGGNGTYNLNGGNLLSYFQRIGLEGTGTFKQTGGTNTVTTDLVLGQESGAKGYYTLEKGDLSAFFIQIGASGTGEFKQTGGTVTATGPLNIGQVKGSAGTYALSGTGELNANDIGVGLSGKGIFTQESGTKVNVSGGVVLGYDTSGTGEGTYNLQGGQLVSASLNVGSYGTGTFKQTGGSNDTELLVIGANYDSSTLVKGSGEYHLSGSGSTLSVTGNTTIGQDGTGFFYQSSGTHTVGDILFIGSNATGVGTYTMTGGDLSADRLGVGRYGSGTFHHSGGNVNVANEFAVTTRGSGSGTYNLGGTGSLAAYLENIGKSGTGTFNQTGGTNTVTTDLIVGNADTNGIGSGTYNQFSGINTVSGNLIIANNGGTGTYNFSGGSLSAANIIVNKGGLFKGIGAVTAGSFIVNGGTVAPGNSPGTLTINGNYTQAGGILEIELGGTGENQYDILNITGTADLNNGALKLLLYGGYIPTGDDSFDVVFAKTITGLFTLDGSATGWTWNIAYLDLDSSIIGADTVRLTAEAPVPIPPTVWLLGSGLVGLIGLRRRFRK